MNEMRLIAVVLILSTMVCSGCKKEDAPTQAPTPGKIAGKVTDSRSSLPIGSASINTNPATSVVTTDTVGTYTVLGVSPGQYTLTATKLGYSQNSVTVSVSAGSITNADISLSMMNGSVQGKVTAALSGFAIVGAAITTQPSTITTQTDSSGNYSLTGIPGGAYSLVATKGGFITGTSTLNVIPNGTSTMNIALADQVPTNGLAAYFPFNGNANDASGSGYHGVVYGAVLASDRFQKTRSAYQFDGSSSYIDIPNTSSLNFKTGGFSLAAWVNFTDDSYNQTIVGKAIQGVIGGYLLAIEGPKVVGLVIDGQQAPADDSSIKGGWHFICGVYDGTTGYLYLDGQQKTTKSMTYVNTNTTTIKIGSLNTPGFSHVFKGMIDDVRIFSKPLTQAEVQSLYHEGGW